MFKAITKGKVPAADGKGTLTALWGKAQPKAEAGGGTPAPPASDPQADAAAEGTPAAAAKAGGGGPAAPATGGDVAIGAAPEPSPEPALAAAQAAAAAEAAAAEQQQGKAAEPAAAAKPGGKASGGASDKKRKRSAAEAFSEGQLTKLQAAFAENEYPNTAAKAALAEELGLEAAQVNKWFEKQRKLKREETGEAPKRGRPSGKASGSAKAAPAAASGDAAAAAVAAEGPEAAAAAAAEPAQQDDAMEVDGVAPAAEPVQQEQQQEQQAAAEEVQPMATDEAAAGAPAATPTPAAAAAPAATPAQQPSAAPAAAPATTGATSAATGASPAAGTSVGKGAEGGKPGKTPASAAPARIVSAEEKAQLMAALEAEAAELRQQGLAPALQPLPDAAAASGGAAPERQPFSDARLAAAVAGQRASLSQLTAALLPLFKAPEGDAPLEEAVLRSRIIDLAARKSFGPKDGGAALVDALEDASADHLWQWELRDQKVLPKDLRPAAAAAKKRAARVAERLSAVAAALRLLGGHSGGKAPAKLAKALAALDKAKTLAQIDEEAAAEREAAAAKEAAKKAAAGGKAGLSAEEKARLKAEKEAAKEAEKAAKEAEKAAAVAAKEAAKEAERAAKEEEKAAKAAERERLKAEKEAEKEKAKAEKEAEKERKHREAEEAKALKKAGFKDGEALKKSSAKFVSFFQAKAGSAPGSAAKPGASQPTLSRAASQQPSQGGTASQQPAASGAGGATATGKREKGYAELHPKDSTNVVSQPTQPCRAAEMDAAAAGPATSFEQAQADWQALLAGMKARRQSAPPRLLGLPPSWARKSGAEEREAARLQTLLNSGLTIADIRTWRRKFVWCPADSQRPPFYGSCKPSPTVGPRRPFAKDEALDYEVMSDQDWEEEPEGSSLSGDDREEESEAPGAEEELADSFMVSDGYLSEDEGVQLEGLAEDGADMMDVDVTGPVGAAGGEDRQRLQRLRMQLEVQMKRAVNGGKPLIISRLPAASEPAAGSCIRGDPALLQALAIEVLLPGVRVGLPEDLAAEAPGAAAAGAPATGGRQTSPAVAGGAAGGTAGRPSAGRPRERPDDLLPALMRYVQGGPRKKKNEIVDEFIAAHLGRKVPKAWVQAALKEHAEHLGASKGWALKPSGLALLEAAAPAAAAEGGAAAAVEAAAAAAGPTPGAVAAAAAAGGAAAAAVGGVEPTPAAAKQASGAAGIERFFKKDGPMATPAVPSALRPNAPPSELKVPGRLVTTTAAGAEEAAGTGAAARSSTSPGPLTVPDSVSGTADPFWRELLRHIEGADAASQDAVAGPAASSSEGQQQQRFAAVFQPAVLAHLVAGMPAGVLTALVAGVAAAGTPPATRAAYLRCLEAAVHTLAAAEAEAAGDNSLSASQQVWQPRGAPPAASLAELAREPHLLPGLQACADAAGMGVAEAAAAAAAAGVARALLASDPARMAVQAAAASGSDAEGGGSGLVQQLEALAAAQQA